VVYGRDVLSQRQQTEVAYLNATTAILVPAGVCNRWINYTAHPSQTPGEAAADPVVWRLIVGRLFNTLHDRIKPACQAWSPPRYLGEDSFIVFCWTW